MTDNGKELESGARGLRVEGSEDIAWQLLDTGPDAMVVVDERGRIVLVNVQADRVFGYPRAELLGQHIEVLIPERYRGRHVLAREQYTRSPRARPMGSGLELFGRRHDGSEFPAEISLSPLSLPGRVLISANIRDVSDRREQELHLKRKQGHLLSAIESIPGAFMIFDVSDQLVVCNSACRYLLGRRVDFEIVGRSYEEILHANLAAESFALGDAESMEELRKRWMNYHRNPEGALRLRTTDGHCLQVVERRTAEGGTVVTIWDVSEEVEREAELMRARSAAEAASSAKSEFLASMSHELRTPLNAILGFAQLLKRDKKQPLAPRHQERIDHVLKGGEHLLTLIDEVLDLARIEAGGVGVSAEPVALSDVLGEVRSTLAPMASRANISLTVPALLGEDARVQADRTRFKQILMNYGSNSIKYGRPGGAVEFRVTPLEGGVRVSVVDDGFGIPLEKQDKIFTPFQRAGQETGTIEGTGIGLAISKRLAELMDGSVGFHSEPGKGSEFWVELPLAKEPVRVPVHPRPELAEVLVSSAGPRHAVVYVEDNPSSIAFMEDLLADFEQVELITAPTAEIGVELVRARLPKLVIMDIHLPGMDGFQALSQLREWPETRDIPVIALSAAAMVGDANRVNRAGFYRYLTKPVKVDEFARVLGELLA